MFKFVSKKMQEHRKNPQAGFLLAELIISVFIFGVVMSICVGSLVLALDANKKTQSLKSVLNNLNVVLETMTKSLATGRYYHCWRPPIQFPYVITNNCTAGFDITFLAGEDLGEDGEANDVVTYMLSGNHIDRYIYIDENPLAVGPIRMTAPEVNITDMRLYVTGSSPNDTEQPKVLIVIDGQTLPGPRSSPTAFSVQTLVSMLAPDF